MDTRTGVAVGGPAVGTTRVVVGGGGVGGTGVAVGGTGVGGTGVAEGGTGVAVGGTDVGATGVALGPQATTSKVSRVTLTQSVFIWPFMIPPSLAVGAPNLLMAGA